MDVYGHSRTLSPHAPRGHSMPQTVYAERETMISRGDLFSASLDPVVGSEQGGTRPVVVVQNNVGNRYSPTVIVLAVTSRMNKARLPTHIEVPSPIGGLPRDSVILAEQVRTLDKQRLTERLGALPESVMAQVDRALLMSLGIGARTDY